METSKQRIRRHMQNDNGVVVGEAVLFEMTRETAVQGLVDAIIDVGGEVISQTSEVRQKRTGARTTQTVHSLLAIIPRSVVD